MNITLENIDDYFTYHPPTTQERIDAHKAVNEAAKAWAIALLKWGNRFPDMAARQDLSDANSDFMATVAALDLEQEIRSSIDNATEVIERYRRNISSDSAKTFLPLMIHQIQFCRMMANQAITIADIQRQRETV